MRWIIVTTLVLYSAGFAQTVQNLTLGDAIALGMENSKLIRISDAKVDAAAARASEANAVLLPSLKFDGSYKRLSDVDPFQIKLPISPVPFTISPTVLDNYTMKIMLQQPLFTGFKLRSNARAAGYLADAGQSDNRNDRADLVLNITAAYWTLYQTEETRHYVDENVTRLQTYLKDTDNLMKAGLATRNDRLKIEVQLSNAELMQIDAVNDVQLALMNLNNAIGQSLDTEVSLASKPGQNLNADSSDRKKDRSSGELVAQALNTRPDLQAMQYRVEASKAGLEAVQGSWWPQLFLTGAYYYSRPNVRYQPTRDEFKSTWELGLQVQFDVWNWGITADQADQASATVRQNEFLFGQMKDNAALEVKRSLLSERRSLDKIAVARLAIDQAEENVRSTSYKFREGLATSTDLLDANLALLQSQTNLAGALVEYELAHARLMKATGATW